MIKFTQDILTGLYNMTKDENIIEPFDLKKKKKKKKRSKNKGKNGE